MLRMKYLVGAALFLSLGLSSARIAVCEAPGPEESAWDNPPSQDLGDQVAFMQDGDREPERSPGPPRKEGGRSTRTRGGDPVAFGPPGGPGMAMPGGGMMGGRGPMGPMGPMRPGMGGIGFGHPDMSDPELADLMKKDWAYEQESQKLAQEYEAASEEQREEIKKEIQEVVGKQFQVRQERRKRDIEQIEKQVQRLRDEIERREKAREKLIERRVSDLLKLEMEF